jgi:hypothetical protein
MSDYTRKNTGYKPIGPFFPHPEFFASNVERDARQTSSLWSSETRKNIVVARLLLAVVLPQLTLGFLSKRLS